MNTNWGELSQAQLEQMAKEIRQEIESRKTSKKQEAWEKVKTAITEYLKISYIQVETTNDFIYVDNDNTIDVTTPGYIKITP